MNLGSNYRVIYDDNNVTLQFYEQRTRTKKSGLKESYEFTENFYYPTLKHALKSYLNKSLVGSESIDVVLQKISKVEDSISKQLLNK